MVPVEDPYQVGGGGGMGPLPHHHHLHEDGAASGPSSVGGNSSLTPPSTPDGGGGGGGDGGGSLDGLQSAGAESALSISPVEKAEKLGRQARQWRWRKMRLHLYLLKKNPAATSTQREATIHLIITVVVTVLEQGSACRRPPLLLVRLPDPSDEGRLHLFIFKLACINDFVSCCNSR